MSVGNNFKASGTFIKKGPFIFRTQAYLTWGDCQDTTGKVIMINPGSSRIADFENWADWLISNKDQIEGTIMLDRTLSRIKSVIEDAYEIDNNVNVNVKVEIQNLFNLREPNPYDANCLYNKLNKSKGNEIYADILQPKDCKLIENPSTLSWVWIAWGYSNLENFKETIEKIKNEFTNKLVWANNNKNDEKNLGFYHPSARKAKKENLDKIKEQIKVKVQNT